MRITRKGTRVTAELAANIGGKPKCPEVPLIVRCAGWLGRHIHRIIGMAAHQVCDKSAAKSERRIDEDENSIGNSSGGGIDRCSRMRESRDGRSRQRGSKRALGRKFGANWNSYHDGKWKRRSGARVIQ
jgi:hypothetical protein